MALAHCPWPGASRGPALRLWDSRQPSVRLSVCLSRSVPSLYPSISCLFLCLAVSLSTVLCVPVCLSLPLCISVSVFPSDPAPPLPGVYAKERRAQPWSCLHARVHSSTIHNHRKVEATRAHELTNGQTWWSATPPGLGNGGGPDTCDPGEPRGRYARRDKPVTRGPLLHDSLICGRGASDPERQKAERWLRGAVGGRGASESDGDSFRVGRCESCGQKVTTT